MIVTIVFLITAMVVVPCAATIILLSRGKPRPITLADDLNTRPRRFSKVEMEQRRNGHSVVLGTDMRTRQEYVLPEKVRYRATLIVGGTGVGKTTFTTASFIHADISRNDIAVVVFDGQKTELTDIVIADCEQHGREVVIFPAAGFNPLAGRGTAEERAEAFANLFAQVRGTQTSDAGKFYLIQAQIFIRRVIPLFERAYGRPMTLRELYLLATNEDMREQTLDDAGDCMEAAYFLEGTRAWTTPMWASATADLCGMIDSILVGDRKHLYCDNTAPSLEECIEARKVIIIREGSYKNTTDHILGVMFLIKLQEYARARTDDENNFMISVYLDEAYQYFNDQYPAFLSQSRKKNITQHLLFQTFKHFEPYTTLLTTNCKTWIVLGGLNSVDATFVSETIGKRLHRVRSRSRQDGALKGTESDSYVYDYLVQPQEVMELGEDRAILLSQKGRQRDATRFLTLVPPLELDVTRYEEPPMGLRAVPELIWDEIRRVVPPAVDTALEGEIGAVGEDVAAASGAADWLPGDGESA